MQCGHQVATTLRKESVGFDDNAFEVFYLVADIFDFTVRIFVAGRGLGLYGFDGGGQGDGLLFGRLDFAPQLVLCRTRFGHGVGRAIHGRTNPKKVRADKDST